MKKMFAWLVPVKSLSAMLFAGFIVLYMAAGTLSALITGGGFEYAIPFAYALESAALSVVISVLWALMFSEIFIRKMRFYLRLIIFALSLLPVFAVCLLIFSVIPAGWSELWPFIAGAYVLGLVIISLLFECYFRVAGRRYTEMLNDYKAVIQTAP